MRPPRALVALALALLAGCQLGDDTLDELEPAARAAPPALVVGAEKSLDTPVPGRAIVGAPRDSRLIWTERADEMVVWRQERLTENGVESEIWAAVLHQAGVSGPGAVRLSREPGPYRQLELALRPGTENREATVTWRTETVATTVVFDIRARRQLAYDEVAMPLEHDDEAFDRRGDYTLRVWIDAAGDVIAQRHLGAPVVVSAGVGVKSDVGVAYARGSQQWLVTWREGDDIHATRLSRAASGGGPLDTHLEGAETVGGVAIPIPGVQSHPAVDCDRGCVVIYEDDRNAATTGLDVYATTLSVASTPAAVAEVALSTAPGDDLLPEISGAGGQLRLVSWSGEVGGERQLRLRSLTAALVPSPEIVRLDGPQRYNDQRDAAVAASALGELIVWADARGTGGGDIVGIRYAASGAKLDATALTIGGATGQQATPAADHDGASYVVAWSDGRAGEPTIRAAEVGLDGVVAQPDGIAVSAAAGFQTHPAVAGDGGGATLVVWEDRRDAATTGVDLYGAILAGGAVIVPELPICTAPGDQRLPSATYDAATAQFLVAWSDGRGADADVYAARVSLLGATPDGNGVALTAGLGDQVAPDVAVHGGVPLVAWEDHRAAASQVFATRISLAGAPAPVTAGGVLIAGAGATRPQVAAMADDAMLVAWLEPRTADVAVARMISGTGELGPPTDLAAAETESDVLGLALPVVAALPFKLSLAYARPKPPLGVDRVFRRVVSTLRTLGTTCSQDAQCDSGFCVDAVCCDAACGGTSNFDCQACSIVKGSSADGSCEIVTDLRVCRKNADPFCDTRELCDGSAGAACPADVGQHAGDACTAACGAGVCPPADETGAPHACDCP